MEGKEMKKRISVLLVVTMCAALLGGCGSKETTTATSEPAQEEETEAVESETAEETGEVDYTQGDPVTITIAHYYPEDNPHHTAMVQVKEYLEEVTGGRITCEIYSNGSYGDQMNSVQAVMSGALDVFDHSFDASYYAPAGVVQGPYLFRSYDHWHNFVGSDVYNELVAGLEEGMGVKVLSAFHYGFREVLSTKKCETVDDFSNILMRVVNIDPYPTAATVLGATGNPIGIDDVYMSLKTGVVDATENPMAQLNERSFDEVTKYLIKTDHMLAVGNWIMSEKCWNGLSETDQELVEKAFWDAAAVIEQGYEDADAEVEAKFVDEGIEVVTPDKQQFMDRLSLVFEDYPEWEEYYERIQAIED
jgi:TRAP-type C4-dicarboxylate transport system substrate-binding protein